MKYSYRIYDEVYNDILSGKKNIEFRLLNEKSDSIKIGDKIKFVVIDNENKYLITKVMLYEQKRPFRYSIRVFRN